MTHSSRLQLAQIWHASYGICPLWKRGNEGDLLWVAPSIPVTCKIPLNLPFLKEENCGVLFLTSIYSCR
ncbi:MAG: hypothetical protein PHD14_02500 [Dehalococcoidales bacterium]|nr:hypothetical protein [Dehalococcoidales bacterium]